MQNISILSAGSLYFVYRPKIERAEIQTLTDVQRLHIVLHPEKTHAYIELTIGKKRLPQKTERFFGFVDHVFHSERDYLHSLQQGIYATKSRGKRIISHARLIAQGRFAFVAHDGHTHLLYKRVAPRRANKLQQACNIKPTGDLLVSIKNPHRIGKVSGLESRKKAVYPQELQQQFYNYQFISLPAFDFLTYPGTELLLIGKRHVSSMYKKHTVHTCLESAAVKRLFTSFV